MKSGLSDIASNLLLVAYCFGRRARLRLQAKHRSLDNVQYTRFEFVILRTIITSVTKLGEPGNPRLRHRRRWWDVTRA